LIFKQTSTAVEKKELAAAFNLSQNYPNPFNPVTNISYQLAKGGHVTLKIYNILGYEIATLVNEYKPKGKYDIKYDASNLASGVYIYKMSVSAWQSQDGQAGSFSDTKKFILMK